MSALLFFASSHASDSPIPGLIVLALVGGGMYAYNSNPNVKARKQAAADRKASLDAQIKCPHCEVRGSVTTSQVKKKRGISGGKVTGALMTGGVSLLATGLASKHKYNQYGCRNCGQVWASER